VPAVSTHLRGLEYSRMPTRASGGLTQVRTGSSPCCETRNSLVKCGWSVRPHSATISFSAQSVDGTRPFDHSNQRRTVASPCASVRGGK